jgi:hypothetical protein
MISTRQAKYDLAQHRFLYLFCRLRGREPLHNALMFFRPLFVLAPDLQWKDTHFTDDDAPILHSLFIGERPSGALGNRADNPSLFESFTRSRVPGDLPFFGQPFGMTQRRVSRDVISMNCGRERALSR